MICVYTKSKFFKTLAEKSGLSEMELSSKMSLWMTDNNTTEWPTLEQLGITIEGEIVLDEPAESFSYLSSQDDAPQFNPNENDEVSEFAEAESSMDDINIDESEKSEFGPDDVLDSAEKSEGISKSFANLTRTLFYQRNDVDREIKTEAGKLQGALAEDTAAIDIRLSELRSLRDILTDKIKASKKISNLEQLVEFGIEAHNEVVKTLSKGNLTDKQLNYIRRITNFWIKAGDFGESQFGHVLFGYDYDKDLDPIVSDGLIDVSTKMQKLGREIAILEKSMTVRMVKKQLGGRYTAQDIYAAIKDINWGEEYLFGISNYSSPILSAIYATMHKADRAASLEFDELINELDLKISAAKKFLVEKNGNLYDMFYQEVDGKYTGDLVEPYSKEYTDTKNKLLSAAYKAKDGKKKEAWSKFRSWTRENETYIDIRLLFPESELTSEQKKVAEDHKAEIVGRIGQRQFDRLMTMITRSIDRYNYDRIHEKSRLAEMDEFSEMERVALMNIWDHKKSPYIELDRRVGALNDDGSYGSTNVLYDGKPSYADSGVRGLIGVPNKIDSDGKKTKWYDPKFELISKHPETLELFEYIQDTMSNMRSILPSHVKRNISRNTMPLIDKGMAELFKENMSVGMAELWNSMQKSFVVDESSDTEFDEIDINTGKKIATMNPTTYMNSKRAINEEFEKLKLKFIADNGRDPNESDIESMRVKAVEIVNKNRSFDLPKVLKAYTGSIISHKHKANVNDLIKVARRSFEEVNEIVESDAGVTQLTPNGEARVQVGLTKMKASLDYAIKSFQGERIHPAEGKMKKKTLSTNEKKKLAEFLSIKDGLNNQFSKNKISKVQYDLAVKVIDDKIEALGGYVALSNIGDNALKYTQMKGMGLNVVAGAVNLITGLMENTIRAADGRFFNEEQLASSTKDAYSTALDPMKNKSNTKRLIAIEKRFKLVEDTSQELYARGSSAIDGIYIITKKTEFINVMSFAGAFMRNIPVKNDRDEDSNLFEAFDDKGNIKSGWKLSDTKSNDEFLLDVDLRMLQLKHKIHGNYGDKLMGKEKILGRMLFQFRTWMPEMFNARFGKADYDHILQKELKGRWRSLASTMFLGSEYNGNQFSAVENSIHTLKQICKKVLFMRTSFDGRMSETDAANMKANMMELHFMLGIMALMLLLRAAVPDDEKKDNFTYNFLINMLTRQQNDIMVFANPMTFEQINKNVLPVMSILTETSSLVDAVKDEFSDDERQAGRSFVKLAKLVPGATQAVRVAQYGAKEIQN